ncbi:hypothetical protein BJX99DRAFT_160012 [Aspergillus californicus]
MASIAPASQQKLHNGSKKSITEQRVPSWKRRNTTDAPPVFKEAKTRKDNPQIPDPCLFDFRTPDQNVKTTQIPTISQCATHLKLLSVFYQIRRRVLNSTSLDAALGIVPARRQVYRKVGQARRKTWQTVNLRDTSFQGKRQAKWPFYLLIASVRFLKWAWTVESMDEQSSSSDAAIMLPPIDVLMVWHALLLNPSWFESIGFKSLPRYPFPWEQINGAINSERSTWPYNPPSASSALFVKTTLLEADLFKYLANDNHTQDFKKLMKKHSFNSSSTKPYTLLSEREIKQALTSLPRNLVEDETIFLQTYRLAIDGKTSNTVRKLIDAVVRQASFVEKMENHLWIRSPAVEGTLTRAIDRYSKFLKLFRLYPSKMLVPTLDIDLVWHTHQCSAFQYNEAMMKIAGRLIDHNDKLGKNALDPGFERTAALFRTRFGLEYLRCHCWDCEALLSAIQDAKSGEAVAKEVHQTVAYHRAVEIARRAGRTMLPILA